MILHSVPATGPVNIKLFYDFVLLASTNLSLSLSLSVYKTRQEMKDILCSNLMVRQKTLKKRFLW